MGTIEDLVRDLRGFDANAEVAKALKKELAKPVPAVREAIRANAVAILPSRGGLGAWVAAARIAGRVRLSGRTAVVTLRGGRSSKTGKRSDVKRIDQGRTRHPSWGRRGKGQWHLQAVNSGFFTDPAAQSSEWRAAGLRAVDEALEVIRRGG